MAYFSAGSDSALSSAGNVITDLLYVEDRSELQRINVLVIGAGPTLLLHSEMVISRAQ